MNTYLGTFKGYSLENETWRWVIPRSDEGKPDSTALRYSSEGAFSFDLTQKRIVDFASAAPSGQSYFATARTELNSLTYIFYEGSL
ncbi:hypothetical protein HDV00_008057 [Rhizophlyctis rosea]|nr:hypothetical protein HDV00_008057 [Rhizophlyctis rosea]